jgi:hypothetical protein
MEVEQDAGPSAVTAPNLETLELREAVDEAEPILETQSSQAQADEDIMEVVEETLAQANVTNARSSIAEEGAAVRSADEAPPRDDEVTHL